MKCQTYTARFNFYRGFTLIEMLVAVAIIGILAAIIYPSYTSHVVNARRTDAQSYLLEQANLLERQYAAQGRYPESFTLKTSDFYSYSYTRSAADQFVLQAQPTARQSDSRCSALTLTQTGAKTPATAGCWRD